MQFIRTISPLVLPCTLGLALLFTTGCATTPGSDGDATRATRPTWTYQTGPVANEPVMDLQKTILPGDRIVFIGDDMTQQMFYTRALATGLLTIMPQANLRVYNAGRNDATAASATEDLDKLLDLTDPTVVFIALGLNDAAIKPAADQSQTDAFASHLKKLIQQLRRRDSVRQIILVGPPAIQSGLTPELPPDSYNARLIALSQAARTLAADEKTGYIDLFTHTSAVYLGQMQVGGTPLTLGGKFPSEEGHVIIASVLLRGIGVTGPQLDAVGFSPLLPGQMGRIRPALALETHAPSLEQASASRQVYETLLRFDESFFKQWRLAGRHRLSQTPEEAATQSELAWGNVVREVQAVVLQAATPVVTEK